MRLRFSSRRTKILNIASPAACCRAGGRPPGRACAGRRRPPGRRHLRSSTPRHIHARKQHRIDIDEAPRLVTDEAEARPHAVDYHVEAARALEAADVHRQAGILRALARGRARHGPQDVAGIDRAEPLDVAPACRAHGTRCLVHRLAAHLVARRGRLALGRCGGPSRRAPPWSLPWPSSSSPRPRPQLLSASYGCRVTVNRVPDDGGPFVLPPSALLDTYRPRLGWTPVMGSRCAARSPEGVRSEVRRQRWCARRELSSPGPRAPRRSSSPCRLGQGREPPGQTAASERQSPGAGDRCLVQG